MQDAIKMLKLNFPNGESSAVCNKIAQYAQEIGSSRVSSGGMEVLRMPFTKEEEEKFGMEFAEDVMEFTYEYKKE